LNEFSWNKVVTGDRQTGSTRPTSGMLSGKGWEPLG